MTVPPRTLHSTAIRQALGLDPGPGATREYRGVSTDSRTLRPGELFVALSGERHDAADFLWQAEERGAPGAIVRAGSEDRGLDLEYFPVDDPLDALGSLAARVRAESGARVLAITGSSGKTTVKEMVARALGGAHDVHATAGNLNSQVGLPLTILGAPAETGVWVLELGASEPGEIARLTRIARPDHAVITTVGPAHLEAFGTEERVLEEKLDLARGTSADGTVIVGEMPDALACATRALRSDAIVAGIGPAATFRPDDYGVEAERVWFERDGVRVEVPVGGVHHLRDALMAAAAAEVLGVPSEAAAAGLARYAPIGMRGAVLQVGALTVLADCYNANPESFAAAISQCRDLYAGRRLAAFVGSMLELGDTAAAAHSRILESLAEAGFELVAASGLFAEAGAEGTRTNGARILAASDPEAVWEPFADALEGNEVVLVKGSRGARLERIVDRLRARFGEDG